MAIVNKTRTSCTRVKIQINLLAKQLKQFIMQIEDEQTGGVRKEIGKIKYDYFPIYCTENKMQRHSYDERRNLHTELAKNEAMNEVEE